MSAFNYKEHNSENKCSINEFSVGKISKIIYTEPAD